MLTYPYALNKFICFLEVKCRPTYFSIYGYLVRINIITYYFISLLSPPFITTVIFDRVHIDHITIQNSQVIKFVAFMDFDTPPVVLIPRLFKLFLSFYVHIADFNIFYFASPPHR